MTTPTFEPKYPRDHGQVVARFLLLGLLLISLLACGGMAASEDGSMKRISEWTIDTWMTPRPDKPVSLMLAEKDGTQQLFLRYRGQTRPLGAMKRQLGPDVPIKMMFLDIDGNRFIVFSIEDPQKARSVMIYRPDPDFPNQPELSRKGKIIRLDKKGMGVAPIFPPEANDWSHLTRIVVTARDSADEPLVDIDFAPPLYIEPLFQHISLSGS